MSSTTATATQHQQPPQQQQQRQKPQQQQQQQQNHQHLSDDPDKLLNEWLGELENLIGVSLFDIFMYYTSITSHTIKSKKEGENCVLWHLINAI